jgi:hypothetical protein
VKKEKQKRHGKLIVLLLLLVVIAGACVYGYNYLPLFTPSGSAMADLRADAISLEGEPYTGKVLSTRQSDGQEITVMEDQSITVSGKQLRRWNSSMPTEDHDGNSLSHSAWISVYSCRIDILRYQVIDGQVDEGSMTHQYIDYLGYDDNDEASLARAVLAPESKEISYSDSEAAFNALS